MKGRVMRSVLDSEGGENNIMVDDEVLEEVEDFQ